VIFEADFRKILPIVLGGFGFQIVWKCLEKSQFWNLNTSLQLKINMQINQHSNFQRSSLKIDQGESGKTIYSCCCGCYRK
jgi:hypothetical protein